MLLPLFLAVLNRNKTILEDIWEECSFFFNDTHLVILLDFMINQQYTEGLKVILRSQATHQIFYSMSCAEKEILMEFFTVNMLRSKKLVLPLAKFLS